MSLRFKKSVFYFNIVLFIAAVFLAVNIFSLRGREFIQNALAAIGNITGEGTVNYIARFAGAANPSNQIGNSIIYDTGTSVGIGTTSPAGGTKLHIVGETRQQGLLTVIDGSVGIGVTNPSTKLEVNGEILANGYRLNAGNTTAVKYGGGDTGQVLLYGGSTLSATFGANGITFEPKATFNGSIILTPRSSNPSNPVNGMMWMMQ